MKSVLGFDISASYLPIIHIFYPVILF